MAVSEVAAEGIVLEDSRDTFGQKVWDLVRRKPLGAAGAFVVLFLLVIALLADFITVYDPVKNSYDSMHVPPNAEHWMGTDQFGRDILTRIIYGARTALLVGFVASFIGSTLGLMLGVTSAYFGGRFDLIFQRIMDIFMSFPLIIMALAVVSIMGTGTDKVIFAIMIPFIPRCARVVRASALAVREIPYVDAARTLGFNHKRIILRHMVPNVMAPYLIMLTSFMGQAILLEASLSYLGLGVQEPTPAWGLMLQGGAEEYAESAPWIPIFPGLAITIGVFAFNLLGDAVRDTLDPRLRSQ
ncbi:MAG: ABC transporter permease [Nitrospinota bacterium]|jgi:peptide/nickel transport system permease protein|nr:ABC transporter permease [Nitrospinota bacterium]MDP6278110.1 ABC transporter permease [Nitrospinota bacterium]MDP7169040.1 ABC transporter permease [Nitrospinota bacterium]MDP7370405.1 ABC transporter permease [Nitrospinota bacterium]MDP7502667.1 ABC transporter permease [Nitrospinota bacterium]|tara:strand:- start:37 stop:933 length:897 start_codon:yes stop_codon:yes gene_type:complete